MSSGGPISSESRVLEQILRDASKLPVVTLCGSTRFKREYEIINRELTLRGYLVFSVGLFGHSDAYSLTRDQKVMLDALHMEKIRRSDEVFIVDPGGYIGDSTRNEINLARELGLRIWFWSCCTFSSNNSTLLHLDGYL